MFRVAPAEAVSLNDVSEPGFVREEERWQYDVKID